MFRFDYEQIHGEIITAVCGEAPRVMNDGSFSCDRIVFKIASSMLEISVNIDTDELVVELHSSGEHTISTLTDISDVLNVVGRTLGWAWTVRNSQGYQDGFMLALGKVVPDALDPAYAFIGAGSSISVYAIQPLKLPQELTVRDNWRSSRRD